MEYLAQFVHALVSPVNCVGHLGSDIVVAFGHFAGCVGQNLSGAATATGSAVTNVAANVSSIGG